MSIGFTFFRCRGLQGAKGNPNQQRQAMVLSPQSEKQPLLNCLQFPRRIGNAQTQHPNFAARRNYTVNLRLEARTERDL